VSNVIDFLQKLGQDADLRHAPRTALEVALAEANIDPALREALLGADQRKLETRSLPSRIVEPQPTIVLSPSISLPIPSSTVSGASAPYERRR